MAFFEKFVDTIFLKEDSSLERELEALKEIKDKVVEKDKINNKLKININ